MEFKRPITETEEVLAKFKEVKDNIERGYAEIANLSCAGIDCGECPFDFDAECCDRVGSIR